MAAPRKYPDELRERATRMAVEARLDPATRAGTFRRVGDQLGIHPETFRNWVRQAEIDEGHRPGTTTSDAERLAELEKEVRELRRANAMVNSTGRRNTLTVEVFSCGDEGLGREDERCARGCASAMACGSGVASADAFARAA